MNTIRKAQLFLLIPLLTIGHSGSTFAQGSLTPPGAPAPTFKTLSQVEPRFPISDYQTNLTISGSYYLTTNLFSGPNSNDGINIRTNVSNITIDLNGFSIINTNGAGPSSPVGVRISEGTNIVIRNGQIIGFDRAVRAEGLFYGIVVEDVHVHNCRRAGLEANGVVGSGAQTFTARNCVIEGMDGTGEATSVTVDGITLLNCSAVIDNCIVRDIVAAGTGIANCIDAQSPTNTIVNNCFFSNADVGLKVTGGGTRVFYRNNLTAGIATPFSVSGGVDRGGNF
jgi:hypothetical protein